MGINYIVRKVVICRNVMLLAGCFGFCVVSVFRCIFALVFATVALLCLCSCICSVGALLFFSFQLSVIAVSFGIASFSDQRQNAVF